MRNLTNHRVTLVVKRPIKALPCIRQVLMSLLWPVLRIYQLKFCGSPPSRQMPK